MSKVLCTMRRCNWHGDDAEVLVAPNPFDATDEIYGCPRCKQIDCIVGACDEPECWELVSCGTPTENGGYRQTCHKHAPRIAAAIEQRAK